MAKILVATNHSSTPVLPVFELLPHELRHTPLDSEILTMADKFDVVLIDGSQELAKAKTICQLFASCNSDVPRILVIPEAACSAITAEWDITDFVLPTIGVAELETRIRLAQLRHSSTDEPLSHGGLTIDESAYTVNVDGRNLDLTYTEFELLRYLVSHPDRVLTRDVLLEEVWGWDYFGGTRTVDVHIRRLRAKLGPEYEALIQTVRNVGYRFSAN